MYGTVTLAIFLLKFDQEQLGIGSFNTSDGFLPKGSFARIR
jgi:hypothetical protein